MLFDGYVDGCRQASDIGQNRRGVPKRELDAAAGGVRLLRYLSHRLGPPGQGRIGQRQQSVGQHTRGGEIQNRAFSEWDSIAGCRIATQPAAHDLDVNRYPIQRVPDFVTGAAHYLADDLEIARAETSLSHSDRRRQAQLQRQPDRDAAVAYAALPI